MPGSYAADLEESMKQDEIDEIWKKTCALLRDALAEVSYETWSPHLNRWI